MQTAKARVFTKTLLSPSSIVSLREEVHPGKQTQISNVYEYFSNITTVDMSRLG